MTTSAHVTTDALRQAVLQPPAIGLTTLIESGNLQTRVDRKYLLPAAIAAEIASALTPDAQALEVDGVRESHYYSTYFDTPARDSFYMTAHRRRRRFKVRTRSYLDSGERILEVKTRSGRGSTVKHRAEHSAAVVDELNDPDLRFVRERLVASQITVDIDRSLDLAPVLSTEYWRSTLYLARAHARVTIDSGLTWRAAGEQTYRNLTRLVVLETKTAGGLCPADRLLWRLGHRPVALSKFGVGMALLDPGLPANRWHRILGRVRGGKASVTGVPARREH